MSRDCLKSAELSGGLDLSLEHFQQPIPRPFACVKSFGKECADRSASFYSQFSLENMYGTGQECPVASAIEVDWRT